MQTMLYKYTLFLVRYFPAPTFLVLGLIPKVQSMCGGGWEMQAMWYLMALAHISPYIEVLRVCTCPNKHKH